MYKAVKIFATFALLSISCSDTSVNNSDGFTGVKIRKITQNQSEYSLFHYDNKGNIVRYESYGIDATTSQEKLSTYANFTYSNNRLTLVDHYVFYNGKFMKSRIEELEYDEHNRLTATKVREVSEITDTWDESLTTFHYDELDQLIKMEVPEWSMDLFFYDSRGNLSKHESYPLFASDYTGPIVKLYTYDTNKNPFYRWTSRFWLPLANSASALGFLLSPNNVLSWDGYSPQTGGIISKGTFEYIYNSEGYPVSVRETAVSPLTDPQPGTEVLFTEYEYVQ